MKQLKDRDRAENLWQMANAANVILKLEKGHNDLTKEIDECLKDNRPNSEEKQIDQDKQFAKLVYNELPLSSDVPLVNRLINMCKERLNITDNDN